MVPFLILYGRKQLLFSIRKNNFKQIKLISTFIGTIQKIKFTLYFARFVIAKKQQINIVINNFDKWSIWSHSQLRVLIVLLLSKLGHRQAYSWAWPPRGTGPHPRTWHQQCIHQHWQYSWQSEIKLHKIISLIRKLNGC